MSLAAMLADRERVVTTGALVLAAVLAWAYTMLTAANADPAMDMPMAWSAMLAGPLSLRLRAASSAGKPTPKPWPKHSWPSDQTLHLKLESKQCSGFTNMIYSTGMENYLRLLAR